MADTAFEREEGSEFSKAKGVALRVLLDPALAGKVFLEGGLAPWVASGRDSGRRHGDVDFSVRLRDMPAVRAWAKAADVYDAHLDSRLLSCNASGDEYGLHAYVDGVLVSFCPFIAEGGRLEQRNASCRALEGYDALFAARIDGLEEADFVEPRALADGMRVGMSTMEACLAAKMGSARDKDAHDMAEIERIGIDPERFARVQAAFATMRIECPAHEA